MIHSPFSHILENDMVTCNRIALRAIQKGSSSLYGPKRMVYGTPPSCDKLAGDFQGSLFRVYPFTASAGRRRVGRGIRS